MAKRNVGVIREMLEATRMQQGGPEESHHDRQIPPSTLFRHRVIVTGRSNEVELEHRHWWSLTAGFRKKPFSVRVQLTGYTARLGGGLFVG